MTADADRYAGAPTLRFLDSYVLDAVGALDLHTAASLSAGTNRLRDVLSAGGSTWQEVVETSLQLPADLPDTLRTLWSQHVSETTARGETPDAVGWTHDLVDATAGVLSR